MGYDNLGQFTADTPSVVANPTAAYADYAKQFSNPAPASSSSSAISLDQLKPETPINLPTQQPGVNPLDATAAGATSATKGLSEYIKELTPPVTDTQKQYDSLTNDISTLLPGLGGKGTAQVQAETDAGLPQLKLQLSDLNSQILAKVAEATKVNASYEQAIQQTENQQGVSMQVITGQQAQQRKLQLAEANSKSADIGLLQARASGLQGNITAMQDNINRAIDLKFQDREDELNLKMSQLELIKDKLSKEESVTAQALDRQYKDQQTKLAEDKAKAKENITLAFQANVQTPFVNKNGEFFDARTGQAFATPQDFFKAAGVTTFDQAYNRGLVSNLDAGKIADVEFVAKARADYPTAGISATDTPEIAAQKIKGTAQYRKETYIAPTGGGSGGGGYVPGADPVTDAYVTAIQNGNATMQQVPAAYRNAVAVALAQGTQSATVVDPGTDAQVKAIIAAHPGEYGNAASAIDKAFGAGTATKYDAQLRAVYNDKKQVSEAFGSNATFSPLAGSRFALEATRITKPLTDLPAYQLVAGGVPYVSRILAASKTPGSVSDQELLDAFTKLSTSGNAITDAQIKTVTGGKSYADAINTFQNKFKNGGVLSDNQRKQIIDIAQKTLEAYKKDYQPIYNKATSQLKAAGVPEQFWTIPDLNTLAGQGSTGNSQQTYVVNGITYVLGPDGLYYQQ